MYTSVFCLGLLVSPLIALPESPTWLRSYGQGMVAGSKQGRPVAVFVGSGPQGQASLVKEGQFSAEALKVLAQSYVCVYVDGSQTSNERLVRDLGITRTGVVISDRTGNLQAFHHDGAISQAELAQRLRSFASPTLVVTGTVSNAVQRVSYYGGANGSAQPATFSPQSFAPAISTRNC